MAPIGRLRDAGDGFVTDDRPRYEHRFRCRTCAHRFAVVRLTAESSKVKTPKCPRCKNKAKPSYMADVGMDVAAGKAPGVTGAIPVRAYDMALEVAAHNSGLTDINDRPRYGEISAPKLEPRLQQQADNFWGSAKQQGPKRMKLNVPLGDAGAPSFTVSNGRGSQPMQQHGDIDTASLISPLHKGGEAARPKTNMLNSWPTG